MKKILIIIALFAGWLQSCDKIDSPYGTATNGGGTVDTTSTDSISGNDTLQKVLLEEYTGHTCINCPAAHAEALALHNLYGKQLVTVSVHAGFYARTYTNPDSSYSYDFTTPVGNDLYNQFIPASQPFPTGCLQRKKNSLNVYQTPHGSWGTNITPYILSKPKVVMHLSGSYNANAKTITATIKGLVKEDINSPLTLSVLFTEDSIVNWQKNGTLNVANYTHRHALRGALNGSWGSSLGTTFTAGLTFNKSYTGNPIQADIVPKHLSIVAILYNATTLEVVQVEERKLFP